MKLDISLKGDGSGAAVSTVCGWCGKPKTLDISFAELPVLVRGTLAAVQTASSKADENGGKPAVSIEVAGEYMCPRCYD